MTTTNGGAWRCDCVDRCACNDAAPYTLTPRADELLQLVAADRDPQLARIDELVRGELVRVALAPSADEDERIARVRTRVAQLVDDCSAGATS
jgi:hypothetical protein